MQVMHFEIIKHAEYVQTEDLKIFASYTFTLLGYSRN